MSSSVFSKPMKRRGMRVVLSSLALGGITGQASAVDLEWANTTPGLLFYDDGANWNPVNAPDDADNILFALDETLTIVLGAPSDGNNFTVTAGDWTFTGGGGTSLDTEGLLTIDDGGLLSGAAVTLTGPSNWNNAGIATVGDAGDGTLTVEAGALMEVSQLFVGDQNGGTGTVTATGAGTILRATLNVNTGLHSIGRDGGSGTINVLDGAALRTSSTAPNDIYVGSGFFDADLIDPLNPVVRSVGVLNVDGAGSFAEAEDLLVGRLGGIGFVNVTNGGQIINTDGGSNGSPDTLLGISPDSEGTLTVDGDNSLFRSRQINVGYDSLGRAIVTGGGVVRTQTQGTSLGDMIIGVNTGSDGKIAVTGTDSGGTVNSLLDVDNDLFVGDAGLGQLNIGRDIDNNEVGTGSLQVDENLIIGNLAGNTQDNRVVVSGTDATANVGTSLIAGSAGTGTFEARNGATITVGAAISAGAAPDGDGTVLIDGPGTTATANNLFIGNANAGAASVGTMTVSNQAVVTITGTSNGVVTLADDTNATGTLTVTGAGSRVESTGGTAEWWVGGSSNSDGIGGDGFLNVLDGGEVITTGRIVLGYKGTATGEVNVDGAGSRLDANGDYILVGFNNDGVMNITGGGLVEANRVLVADASGSTGSVLIDGPGSTLDLSNLLHVGDTVPGEMDISNGGQLNVATGVSSARLIIGDEGGADGSRLTVTGTGSRIDYLGTERISVGMNGGSTSNRALLEVLDGAVVQAVQRDGGNNIVSQGFIVVGDEAGGNGQIDVDGVGSRIEARYLAVGQQASASGVINVTGGGEIELTEFSEIGSAGNQASTMTVSGAGSRFDVGGNLFTGAGGTANGTLNIADGGTVTTGDQSFIGFVTGSVGTANVGGTGATATWQANNNLFIAGTQDLSISGSQSGSGSGTLNVLTNGLVQVTGQTVIKDRGTVTLDGGTLETDTLIFQDFSDASRPGSPTFNFNSGTLRFTQNAGNTITTGLLEDILGANPTLNAGQHLAIDELVILGGPLRLNGGTFSVGSISAANMALVDFDAGTINLTDASMVVTASGVLGKDPTIQPGQAINVTNNVFIQADGTLTAVGDFNAGGTIINNNEFVLIDAGGGKTVNGVVNNTAGASITVVGDVTFNDLVSGPGGFFGPGTTTFAGGFSPGASPGTVSFEGDVVLDTANTLNIELGGLTPGDDYDRLEIDGTASIDGTLDVSLINSFVPAVGNSFGILFANSGFGGSFHTLNLPDISGLGLQWQLNPGGSTLFLNVEAALQGDLDGDGFVGLSDLDIILNNWNQSIPPGDPLADPTGDNFVGLADLDIVLNNWNAGTPPSASTSIPEPATSVLLMGLIASGVCRRGRLGG